MSQQAVAVAPTMTILDKPPPAILIAPLNASKKIILNTPVNKSD